MTALAQALIRPVWLPLLRSPAPVKLWLGLFSLWVVLLSGLLCGVIGSPGALQAWRLHELLETKRAQVTLLQSEIRRADNESALLEKSRVIQRREIRRVLGYAASDEIIFDFSSAERL